jgi:FKBP-type peptidyl-prolyl cis-trans isomerase
LVGKEDVVVPYHIVKYSLREGSGSTVQEGMTIYCLLNVFLIDGAQIVSSRGNKVSRLLLGRNRLIRGLELGLKRVKKSEKLRLVVSAEYGYGGQADISLIPPHSKLVFEVDVLDFAFTPMERMSDTELYYEVYHFLDESDGLLMRGRE